MSSCPPQILDELVRIFVCATAQAVRQDDLRIPFNGDEAIGVTDFIVVRFERAVLLVRQARRQPLIGNNPDLPGCGAVFPGSGPGWPPAFQVAMRRPRSEISPRS
jgi:hypothetical protein